MRRRVSIVLASVLAVFVIASGASAPAFGDPSASIVGTVTSGGVPVAGATVSVFALPAGFVTDVTDSAGSYTLSGLDAGTYTVSTANAGVLWPYRSASRQVVLTTTDVLADFHLIALPPLTTSLSGVISDTLVAGGLGINQVSLNLTVPLEAGYGAPDAFGNSRDFYAWATTDSSGRYEFPALPAGARVAELSITGPSSMGAPSAYFSKSISIAIAAAATLTRDTTLALKPTGSGSVTGVVTLQGGNLDGFVYVGLRPAGSDNTPGPSLYSTSAVLTDAEEFSYVVPNVANGTYRVEASIAGQQPVSTTVVVSGVPAAASQLVIRPYRTGSGEVSGRVVDDRTGHGLANARVGLYPTDSALVRGDETYTDADGRFTFSGLPNGSYGINAYIYDADIPEGAVALTADDYTALSAIAVVTSGSSPSVTLHATSLPAGSSVLEGRVRDGSTYLPVAGATVSLGRYNSTFSRGGIETASDGRFRVTGLPVGTYDVYVELEGYTQSYSTMQIEVGGNAVVIPIQRAADESSGGSTTGPGAVTVELVDQDDVPIDIGSVSILPPSGLYFDSRTGLPDSAGRAAFSNLALGPWEVTAYASAADGSSLLFPTKIADLTSTDFAETVRLAGGAPSRITGTIDLNEFSSDVVYVALFDDRGRLRSSGDVDENGAFTIQRVAPGSYYLQLGGGFGVSGDWVGPPPEILPGQVYWSSTTTSGVANMSDATLITVGSGTESGNHRLAATAGATVTGQIEIAGPTGASALPPTRCAYVLPYREIGSEWRLVDVETWACGAEPIFGKGMPAGRYKFQIGDFYSGSSAILPSYVGGATLETATVFDLVAGQVRDLGTIVAQVAPPGSTLQAVDLAFLLQNGVDISLYEDLISASDQLESGGDVTIEVGDDLAGQYVNVSANSTPQVVGETWQQVAADGTVTVTLPPDLVGSHKLVVADTTGQLVGWTAVEIAQGTSTGGSTGGTSSGGSSTASKPAGKVATTSEATPVPTTTATASPTPTPVATEGPEATPSTEPQTASGAPGGDGGWIIWVVGGGLVVLVGAAAVLIFRRRLV